MLSGSRLGGNLATDIRTALDAAFPTNAGLLPAEQAGINASKTAFCNAIGNPIGTDTVTEITTNAVTSTPGVQPGGATISGAIT